MNKWISYAASALLLCSCGKQMNFETLLTEAADKSRFGSFPEYLYQTRQAASGNIPDSSQNGKFIRTETGSTGKQEWVIMEDSGKGVLTHIQTVCFYKNPADTVGPEIAIYLDGKKNPEIRTNLFQLVKGQDFVKAPFAQAVGYLGNMYLPIPYAKGCKITLDREPHFYRIGYRSYEREDKPIRMKSFSLKAFNRKKTFIDKIADDVKNNSVKTEIPEEQAFIQEEPNRQQIQLSPKTKATLEMPQGNRAISCIRLKITAQEWQQALRSVILIGTFDQLENIWCPLGDFFGIATGMQPYDMWERSVQKDSSLVCRFVMPYREHASIAFQNLSNEKIKIDTEIETVERPWIEETSLYFFARWVNSGMTETHPNRDTELFRMKGKGYYIGHNLTSLMTGEQWQGYGTEKIYIDNDVQKRTPTFSANGLGDFYNETPNLKPNKKEAQNSLFLSLLMPDTQTTDTVPAIGYATWLQNRFADAILFENQIQVVMNPLSDTTTTHQWMKNEAVVFFYADSQSAYNQYKNTKEAARPIMTVQELREANIEAEKNN